MHYWNCMTWIMLHAKIHCWKVVTIVSSEAAFFGDFAWSLIVLWSWNFSISKAQVLGATISWYQKIIFNRGPNMALQRFCVHSHDQPFILSLMLLVSCSQIHQYILIYVFLPPSPLGPFGKVWISLWWWLWLGHLERNFSI